MRPLPVALLSLAFLVSCAQKTTPPASAQSGANAVSNGSGAQAAARLTVADLDARMKTVGTALGALRMKLMTDALGDAAKDAQTLAVTFGEVERFFQQRNRVDAVTWAQQARKSAQEAAGAATAGDRAKASTAMTTLQQQCSQCHAAYREGDAQTGYRIKAGTVEP